MMRFRFQTLGAARCALAAFAIAVMTVACAQNHATSTIPSMLPNLRTAHAARDSGRGNRVYAHIVIDIQENRSFDNLFAGAAADGLISGIDTTTFGYGTTCTNPEQPTTCNQIPLQAVGYESPWAPDHAEANILAECNAPTPLPAPVAGTSPCRMNGFQNEGFSSPPPAGTTYAYGYLPPAEIAPYIKLANTYGLADELFSAGRGPSFPGHVFLMAGLGPADDPTSGPWTCAERSPTVALFTAWTGSSTTQYVPPCFTYPTLVQELNARHISWKYYNGETPADKHDLLMEPLQAFKATYYGNAAPPPRQPPRAQFFRDLARGGSKRCDLPAMSWITPNGDASDHAGWETNADGPYWVATVYEAIAQSPCYKNTAFLVVWDDSGGWFDHVAPPFILTRPPANLAAYRDDVAGFRVPLLFIAPNAVRGASHVQRDFGSILGFIERNFGLKSLRGEDLDFGRNALQDMYVPHPTATITPIPVSKILRRTLPSSIRWLLAQPYEPSDDE